MPLLLVDLDNTLIDRAASLARWAEAYLTERNGEADPALVAELIRLDGDGLRPKPAVAADLTALLGLTPQEESEVIAVLRAGVLEHLRPDPAVVPALEAARSAGYVPLVVTNGNVAQQESKVRLMGLEGHVAGMVVSEGVGVRKPDAAIFHLAAEAGGDSLEGAWMIGDSAEADVRGGANAGIPQVWLRRGRSYPATEPAPTAIADSFAEAVQIVLASTGPEVRTR
ncbi:HAD family hydrolase [Pseudactinotalea suaedae]|uniref:HAD family hydrolase n=1 Tax=Pseudactinotalea suaedae TaxID=1524924 RepID=UPI0012E318F2|nr:HAD family hydrolase [Pseudactinotalea suaedae]